MLKNRFRRPSPALVISVVALVFAVGGGSFALAITDKKSDKKIAKKVANKQITRRAPGLSVSHANTAANASALGGVPASSFHATRWALVAGDGSVLAQSGGISVAAHSGGFYNLDFGSDQSGKAILATTALLGSSGGPTGSIRAGVCGGGSTGFNCVIGPNDANHVVVDSLKPDNTGDQNATPFFVVVFE